MKRLLATAIALSTLGAIPAIAEVDAKTHKLCLEAKDYVGCVRAMSGDLTPSQRVINVQGASETEGNSCPDGMAFAGGSTCNSIKCVVSYKANQSQLILKDKGWKCKKHFTQIHPNVPVYGDVSERTYVNPECPMIKLKLGYNSTCDQTSASLESPKTENKPQEKCTHRDRMSGEC